MKKVTAVFAGLLVASSMAVAGEGGAKEASFSELDADQDGRLSQSEVAAHEELSNSFANADQDQNGYLSSAEFDYLKAEMEEAE